MRQVGLAGTWTDVRRYPQAELHPGPGARWSLSSFAPPAKVGFGSGIARMNERESGAAQMFF